MWLQGGGVIKGGGVILKKGGYSVKGLFCKKKTTKYFSNRIRCFFKVQFFVLRFKNQIVTVKTEYKHTKLI